MFEIIFNDPFDKYKSKFLKEILELTNIIFYEEKLKKDFIVEITIVNNDEIRKLNNKYRNIDKETDVLSFGSISSIVCPFNLLGEIFINYQKVKEQAKALNQQIVKELLFLITHGILHLLDYDHDSFEKEKIMISKQKKILDNIK